jgi:hypothetical protein
MDYPTRFRISTLEHQVRRLTERLTTREKELKELRKQVDDEHKAVRADYPGYD